MSATQRAPSGPVRSMVGRNQGSVEARNSRPDRRRPPGPGSVGPSGVKTIRRTRLWTGSLTKRVDAILRAEQVVAVGGRAVGRGHLVRRAGVVEPGERPAVGAEVGVEVEQLAGAGQGQARVPPQGVLGQDVMPGPDAVVVAEPAAPVVAMPAELGLAALGLEPPGVGVEPEVAAPDRDRPRPRPATGSSRRCRRWPRRPARPARARTR